MTIILYFTNKICSRKFFKKLSQMHVMAAWMQRSYTSAVSFKNPFQLTGPDQSGAVKGKEPTAGGGV